MVFYTISVPNPGVFGKFGLNLVFIPISPFGLFLAPGLGTQGISNKIQRKRAINKKIYEKNIKKLTILN